MDKDFGPLDVIDSYFHWLCEAVGVEDDPGGLPYYTLLYIFHDTPFWWSIDKDGNRAADGKGLRAEFANTYPKAEAEVLMSYLDGQCSVLEMLVALAMKIEGIMYDYHIGDRTQKWFWEMVDNLGLMGFTDYYMRNESSERDVRACLDVLLGRKYDDFGNGSLFPMGELWRKMHKNGEKLHKNRRKIEIWDQMQEYLIEKYPL